MQKLSVVIITFNEEENIGRCLQSVAGIADDIVVMDSFSTDNTEQICRQFPVRFVQAAWQGYAPAKNYANSLARYDWILSLDADEVLSDTLQQAIRRLKEGPDMPNASFNRLTNYCGHWVRHCGWYPDVKVRLFDRRKSKWVGYIHEQLQPLTEVVHLDGDCLHYSYHSVAQHYTQADKFSTMAARSMFEAGKKAPFYKLIVNPAFKFINHFVLHAGFLDGRAGYLISRISAYAVYLKYKKLRTFHQHAAP